MIEHSSDDAGFEKLPTDDVWFDKYGPIPNDNPETSGYGVGDNQYMYETHGKDLAYIEKMANLAPDRVWTMTEDEGKLHIQAGFRTVNRFGYFFTEEPAESPDECYENEIIMDNELDEAPDEPSPAANTPKPSGGMTP